MKILKLKGYYSAGTLFPGREVFAEEQALQAKGNEDADPLRYGTKDSSRCVNSAHSARIRRAVGAPIKEDVQKM
jgi:hypothetical protein